jgi:electron transfer flavoprotein alpha subunit
MADGVLAILTEASGRGLTGPGREAVGLAAAIAAITGGEVAVAILAPDNAAAATEAGERGAARVFTLDSTPATSDELVSAAESAATAPGVGYVVINRGAHVLDLAPRLAARLGGGCVMGVTAIRAGDGGIQAEAAIYGGAARAIYRFKGDGPRVLSGAPGVAAAPERVDGRTAEVVVLPSPAPGRVRVVEPIKAPDGPRLEDARVVVSGGRGIKQAGNYGLIQELAAALGGMPGASRAIVDDAWATPAQQVGLTGKIVTPQVYIAAGISGASQHMAGCSNSRTLVAINTDPDAPIFKYAHLGIVDNCLEVLPELIRLANERGKAG